MFIIDLPFDYMRKCTMPPCEEEHWSHKWAVIWPIPGLLFLIFTATLHPQWYWLAWYHIFLLS
jgi:hypothetical protein